MTLFELKKGDRAVVLTVGLARLTKERLRALGLFTGEKILILKVSKRKKVYLIQTLRTGTKFAIDGETAAGIKIWQT